MTKADIVEALYEKVGFSKKEAADLVELVFEQLKGTLAQGQKIKISGVGNFVVREKRSRVGRNPQTGKQIEITARRVLTFRPSQVLRSQVNSALEGRPITPDSARGVEGSGATMKDRAGVRDRPAGSGSDPE
jgi:integration host factor subunit alpha